MQISSLIFSQLAEKTQVFQNSKSLANRPTMNNYLSQPNFQLPLNQQIKSKQKEHNLYQSEFNPSSRLRSTSYYELPSQDKSVQITLLKIQNKRGKQDNEKLRQTVNKLRKELSEKVEMLQKFNNLMKIKYAEIKKMKCQIQSENIRINELQKQNNQLEQQLQQQKQLQQKHQRQQKQQQQQLHKAHSQQIQKIQTLYITKSTQLDQLLEKIYNLQHQNFTNEIYQMKISKIYDQLDEEKRKNNQLLVERSQMTQIIHELKEKVGLLQYQNEKIATIDKINYQSERIEKLFLELNQVQLTNTPIKNTPTKQSKQSQHLNAFEEALKVHLNQIDELKKTIENSQQIIQSLKDNLITSRRELEQLRSQIKITNLKETTQRKKVIMEYRLQLHEKDNQINNVFKKYKTLDEKYKTALNDIKAKDDFLRQHLLGRLTDITAQQYVDSVLKKYIQNFQQLIDLKTQNAQLSQKSSKYLKYEQQIENALMKNKKPQ